MRDQGERFETFDDGRRNEYRPRYNSENLYRPLGEDMHQTRYQSRPPFSDYRDNNVSLI